MLKPISCQMPIAASVGITSRGSLRNAMPLEAERRQDTR